jgi:hypothetical protein
MDQVFVCVCVCVLCVCVCVCVCVLCVCVCVYRVLRVGCRVRMSGVMRLCSP